MNEHTKFEILCALAVVGQASDTDLRELTLHLDVCIDCQNRLADFAQISSQALPLSSEKYSKIPFPRAMTTRFVQRVRAEGIPLRESQSMLPFRLSFASLSWKGNMAAALLLIAMIAGGISKSVHSPTQSTDPASPARLELPAQPSARTAIAPNRSTQTPTKLYRTIPRTSMPTARLATSKQQSGSSPEPFLHVIPDSDHQYPRDMAFTTRTFSSDVGRRARPMLSEANDRSFGQPWFSQPWFSASSPTPFTERSPLVSTPDNVGTYSKAHAATFVTASLTFPAHFFSFRSDQNLVNDSPLTRLQSTPSIDWYQVWLVRTESLRNSNQPLRSAPDVLLPAWPFPQDPKGNQR